MQSCIITSLKGYYYQFFITHSLFHSRLKTSFFCKSFPLQPFFFFFGTDYMIPQLLPLSLAQAVFTFQFFCFTILVVVSVQQIKPTHVGFRAHVKIASHIVSYLAPNFGLKFGFKTELRCHHFCILIRFRPKSGLKLKFQQKSSNPVHVILCGALKVKNKPYFQCAALIFTFPPFAFHFLLPCNASLHVPRPISLPPISLTFPIFSLPTFSPVSSWFLSICVPGKEWDEYMACCGYCRGSALLRCKSFALPVIQHKVENDGNRVVFSKVRDTRLRFITFSGHDVRRRYNLPKLIICTQCSK